jgi:hypothetical protein
MSVSITPNPNVQGPQGLTGTTGIQGVQGTTGLQGITGTQGIQGRQGTNGTNGTQGTQGLQGPTNTTYLQPTIGSTAIPSNTTVTTISGLTLTSPTANTALINNAVLKSPEERWTVSATAATGTIAFDITAQGVLYYTTNASGNWTLNATNVNANLAVNDAISIVFAVTNGTTAYRPTAFQIDGTANTPKWAGGTAPAAGNASAVDWYSYVIVKTAATPTYTVFAGQSSKFA